MSAILSAADLNDFISPSVACIKPVETLPSLPADAPSSDPYEVTTEDVVAASAPPPPAQISLTDCLACSGCVTSAEAVLVSLQSHQEVLSTLDAYASLQIPGTESAQDEAQAWRDLGARDGKIFVASVSPQARASIAATFGVSTRAAGNMIAQLLGGADGLRAGGALGSGFAWVLDTNRVRGIALVGAGEEVAAARTSKEEKSDFTDLVDRPKRPVLTSACPGWICYAEKTHPHVLPHVSKLKSPQALAGTLVKSVLAKKGLSPDKVFHVAVMPCFDKKLEASRGELRSGVWDEETQGKEIRDVDLVITARELVSLATARGIRFPELSRRPLRQPKFPEEELGRYFFPTGKRRRREQDNDAGTSGGYLMHVLRTEQAKRAGSEIKVQRGRNADVIEYNLMDQGQAVLRAARYYGFRNIQNLVRRLRPAKESRMPGVAARGAVRRPGAATGGGQAKGDGVENYDYVEVMACPGGCTNGGGQIKVGDVMELRTEMGMQGDSGMDLTTTGPQGQKEWLAKVDEAYWSGGSEDEDEGDAMDVDEGDGISHEGDIVVDGISTNEVRRIIDRWSELTEISAERLLYTTYRKVESDVGKKGSDVERVAGLAGSIGGGW